MMKLKCFENFEEAMQLYATLGAALEPEMAMALNSAAKGVETDVMKQLSVKGIERDLVEDWDFRKAKPGDLESQAVIAGKRLGLENFDPTPNKFMGGVTKGGVSVNILGKREQFRHTFMGLKTTNPVRVLEREKEFNPRSKNKDPRFRLSHLTLVSVPQVADNDDVVKIVVQNAGKRYLKRFDHVIDRLLEQYK